MTKKKKIITITAAILLFLTMIVGLHIRERTLRKADYHGGKLSFDGRSYIEIDYKEIEPYKEANKIVCKTTDGVWTVYEIEQYPEHEYLVIRTSWEARVLKQVD